MPHIILSLQKTLFRVVFVVAYLGLVSSCTTTNSIALIPKDALFAARANILRATYQVPNWKEIMLDEFHIDVKDADAPTNFLASGKAFIFGDQLMEQGNYLAFSVAIRNSKNLEKLVKEMNPGGTIEHVRHFKYIIKNKNILGWSSNTLLLLNARGAETEDKLKEYFLKLIHLSPKESLIKGNKNFSEVLKSDNDVAFWMNVQKVSESKLFKELVKNFNLSENYLHIFADFDEGTVSLKTQYFTNEALYASYKTMLESSVSEKILSQAPINFPAVLVAVGLNPLGLKQLLKDVELTEKAQNIVTSVNLTLDKTIEMLSGDMLLMLKDVKNLQKDSLKKDTAKIAFTNKKVMSDAVLGLGIKNQVLYDSLMQMLLKTGIMEKKDNYHFFFGEIYVMQKDSMVYFTKNEAIKNDFFSDVKLINQNLVNLAKENWFLFYADENIAEKTIKGRSLVKEIARSLLKNENLRLESATINLANTTTKGKGGQSIVIFKDKSVNSLLAMLEVIREIIFQTKIRLDPNYYEK